MELKTRLKYFIESVISARVIAKIGYESLDDVPKSLPNNEKKALKTALEKSIAEVDKNGLEWKQVSDTEWVANPLLPIDNELDISNDLFFLANVLKGDNDRYLFVKNIALEQFIILVFAQIDGLFHDLLIYICQKENRILKCNKQKSWEVIIDSGNYNAIINSMIDDLLIEFCHKNFQEKVNFLKDKIGVDIIIPESLIRKILLAEQARHLFTHTGGIVSREFIERTKTTNYNRADKIVIDYHYCLFFSNAILGVCQHIVEQVLVKFPED